MSVRATRTGTGNSAIVPDDGRTKRDPRRQGNGRRVTVRATRTGTGNSAIVPGGVRTKWEVRVGGKAGGA
ncbi:hypothetical protein Aglo03_51270 [Actinokineospora globicatena]|uniref:Uncharacterized protein n=1 Tax=Actinokineospora globicatena TaxID=103729 RepID=A0A9W6VCK4_9PSEU|nr:hypothetical protein Aglo03_51270 [Actinokineospora globicatena]